jgi:hypothetical protein
MDDRRIQLLPAEGRNVIPGVMIERAGDVFRLRDALLTPRSRPDGTLRLSVRAFRGMGRHRRVLVNHCYVRDVVLVPGDSIQVGDLVYRFRVSGGGAAGVAARRDSCP